MRRRFALSTLDWTVSGWSPRSWRLGGMIESEPAVGADVFPVPVPVPGSVQRALLDAGEIPDWRIGERAREIEWIENREWIYEVSIPDEWVAAGPGIVLRCLGLDYTGWVLVNGEEVAEFTGTHVPHVVDLTGRLAESGNRLAIVFGLPPRWLGQFGRTSQVTEWKTRFNFTWDWQPRVLQTGIWDEVWLEATDGAAIDVVHCTADADPATATGVLRLSGALRDAGGCEVEVVLRDGDRIVRSATLSPAAFADGIGWTGLPVELWWPNGEGAQPLYRVTVALTSADGVVHDRWEGRVGFRNVAWEQCEGAPEGADPWVCVVNGRPIFLQGVNFPPLAPTYADVTDEQYRDRVGLYRELGLNTFRINGCGFLEKESLYDACDEAGILIWQDAPLSSSGQDNRPPDDEASIEALAAILTSYIERRRHHAALLLWNGGNELEDDVDGVRGPITTRHPLIARLQEVVASLDPGRRFLPGSPTGARYSPHVPEIGTGVHGNTHGPWKVEAGLPEWRDFWERLDSLFCAELGAPGASDPEVVAEFAAGLDPLPVSGANPVWRRPFSMWLEGERFAHEHGRPPSTLEEYVAWSQARQAEALASAVAARKRAFPRTGGALIWCGHDSHPVATNTSIIDVRGVLKPAALALRAVWTTPPTALHDRS